MSNNNEQLSTIPDLGSVLSTYTPDETSQNVDISTPPSFPYVGFYSPKSPVATDIQSAISGIGESDPYLRFRGNFHALGRSVGFLVLRAQEYWADVTDSGAIISAQLNNPGRGTELKHEVLAEVLLFEPGLEEELGYPIVPTVTSFRSTKVPGVKKILEMQKETTTDEWVKEDPFNASMIQNGVPKYARVMGIPILKPKMSLGKKQRQYYLLDMQKANVKQMHAMLNALGTFVKRDVEEELANASEDETPLPSMDDMTAAYDRRLEMIMAKIDKGDDSN